MDSSMLWYQNSLLEDFDSDLQKFYNKVLEKELNLSNNFNALKVKLALKKVVCAYRKETVDSFASNIQFDSPEKRCAYVLKHCSCFTSAVARHFLYLLQENPFMFYNAIHLGKLNVCCLGGGPATDVVALIKVINTFNSCLRTGRKKKLHLAVTVVDLNKDWETTARKVIDTLLETPEFCDSEKIVVSFEFLQADLTAAWKEPLEKVLSQADIVTMVYFVSAVNGSNVKERCPVMLQNIMKILRRGALLFFLDSAKDLHYETMQAALKVVRNLNLVYGPHLQEFHTLSMKSVEKFVELYPGHFSVQMCLSNCFVSSAGWVKDFRNCTFSSGDISFCSYWWNLPEGNDVNGKNFENDIRIAGKNARNKMMSYNTMKQKKYRKKIEKIFGDEVRLKVDDDDDDGDDFREADDWLSCELKLLNAAKSKAKRIIPWPQD